MNVNGQLKLAAIVISATSVRLLINSVTYASGLGFNKVAFLRLPVSIGHDVITTGSLKKETQDIISKTVTVFNQTMDLYGVNRYMVCATSSFCEAENSLEAVRLIEQQSGISMTMLSSSKELEMLCSTLTESVEQKTHLYVNIKPYSTYIAVIKNRVVRCEEEFKIGKSSKKEREIVKEAAMMAKWLKNIQKTYHPDVIVGAGGDIYKTHHIINSNTSQRLTMEQLIEMRDSLIEAPNSNRNSALKLSDYRADSIVKAISLIIEICDQAEIGVVQMQQNDLPTVMMCKMYKDLTDKTVHKA